MTTPLPASPLVEALLALLRAEFDDKAQVFWGGAFREAVAPYAVLWPDTGVESPIDRALNDEVPNDLRYQVTAVGDGPEQAAWVADIAAGVLLTTAPTVSGRRARVAQREGAQPVDRDDDSTGLYFSTAQYLTRSDPV